MALRLGLALCGEGVAAAAHVGVLRALAERSVAPGALCGAGGGALAAALAALDGAPMQSAALSAALAGRRALGGEAARGRALSRALLALTEGAPMRACKTPLALPCVAALSGKGLAFTSAPGLRALSEPAGSGLVFTREAPLWLGVRAAMSAPAWVTPASWMDVPLIAAQEPEACALALRALGAQELLFVVPVYQPDGRPDAFTRCALCHARRFAKIEGVHVLAPAMPRGVGALSARRATECEQAGYDCAARALDGLLTAWGVSGGRILPFRPRR